MFGTKAHTLDGRETKRLAYFSVGAAAVKIRQSERRLHHSADWTGWATRSDGRRQCVVYNSDPSQRRHFERQARDGLHVQKKRDTSGITSLLFGISLLSLVTGPGNKIFKIRMCTHYIKMPLLDVQCRLSQYVPDSSTWEILVAPSEDSGPSSSQQGARLGQGGYHTPRPINFAGVH